MPHCIAWEWTILDALDAKTTSYTRYRGIVKPLHPAVPVEAI